MILRCEIFTSDKKSSECDLVNVNWEFDIYTENRTV